MLLGDVGHEAPVAQRSAGRRALSPFLGRRSARNLGVKDRARRDDAADHIGSQGEGEPLGARHRE